MKKILIVGMENTCRSIVAAEYLKKAVKDKGKIEIEVAGAGVKALLDIPAEPAAIAALKTLGIEGEFKSSPLRKQEVMDAAMIITIGAKIKAVISGKIAEKAGAIFTLKEVAGEAEADIVASESMAAEIKAMIDKGIDKIAGA